MVDEVISKCKKLAQRTHQSTIDWQEIKLACSEEGIVANTCCYKMELKPNDDEINFNP